MQTITIACPAGFTHPNVDTATAPSWLDALGNVYRVTSGVLYGEYVSSDPVPARPNRINVIVGMNGMSALAAMGLTRAPAVTMA